LFIILSNYRQVNEVKAQKQAWTKMSNWIESHSIKKEINCRSRCRKPEVAPQPQAGTTWRPRPPPASSTTEARCPRPTAAASTSSSRIRRLHFWLISEVGPHDGLNVQVRNKDEKERKRKRERFGYNNQMLIKAKQTLWMAGCSIAKMILITLTDWYR